MSQRLVAAGCLGAAVLASMDPTTLSVAGPVIASSLRTSISESQWIVNAFLLALSVLLVPAGAASARIGELRLLKIGSALFALGALGSAVAPSGGWLVAARAVQGMGAAGMIPSGIGLYRASFAPSTQAVAMGVYAGACTAAAALGPVVAGGILELASWRVVFAVTAVAALLLQAVLAASARPAGARPAAAAAAAGDGGSLVTNVVLGIGLTAIAWALIGSGERGWSALPVVGGLIFGCGVLAALVVRAMRGAAGAAGRGFEQDRISAYVVLVVATAIPNLGVIFLLSTFLQRAQALAPLEVAFAVLPCLATTAVLMPWSARAAARYAPAHQIAAGMAVQCAALLWLTSIGEHSAYVSIGPPLVMLGLGIALVAPTLLNGLLGSASPSHSAVMGGVNLSGNQFGGILGVAILGSLVATGVGPRFEAAAREAGASVAATPARIEVLVTQGPVAAAAGAGAASSPALVRAGRHAYAESTRAALWAAVAAAGLSVFLTLGLHGRLGGGVQATTFDPREHGAIPERTA